MRKDEDKWQTPQKLFDELSKKYGPFDIDLCATKENNKCHWYCEDYLKNVVKRKHESMYQRQSNIYIQDAWDFIDFIKKEDKTCWMNLLYSNPLPFIQKAWEDSKHCKIVLLVKVDPSTKFWSVFWDYGTEYKRCRNEECRIIHDVSDNICAFCENDQFEPYNGPKPGCQVHFLPKRVQFDPPAEMKEGNSWYIECSGCAGDKEQLYLFREGIEIKRCHECKGTGKKKLSGPSFASAVVIFDRRGV